MHTLGGRRPVGGWRSGASNDGAIRRLEHLDAALYTRWVRTGTAVAAAGYALVTVLDLLVYGEDWSFGFFSQSLTAACAVVAWFLAGRGKAAVAGLLTIGAVWVELHTSLPFVGPDAAALLVFPVLVMATGILLRGRGAFLLAAVTSVTVPLTIWIGFSIRGAPLPPDVKLYYMLATCSLSMFAAAALVELGLDSFDRVLTKALTTEQRFTVLIEHAPVGILATDADRFITSVSPTAEKLLSTEAAELVGKKLDAVLLRAFPGENDRADVQTLLDRQGRTTSLHIGRPGSDDVELEALSTAVPWPDGSVGIQIILRDVTERRRSEENERLLQAQLEHAQRLEAVGRLAGGVAHDFNNLLTVVGASAELLVDETEGQAKELARSILDAKVRGAALTKQLLAFARKDPVQVRPLSLTDIVRDSVPLIRRFLTEDVELVVDVGRGTPTVMADPAHVEQVLANLVINARDALGTSGRVWVAVYPPGSARSWAGREEWVVESGYVELSVADDGSGMDPEVRSRIFEPFFTTKPRERGTGLGLASVHGIMNQNGGKIRVLSEPGVGTCMLLSWPVAEGDVSR